MAFLRYKKRGHKWYVYEVTTTWDKKSKKPRQKSLYMGVSDSKGGEFSKPGRPLRDEKSLVDFGDSFAVQQLALQSGFSEVLQDTYNDYDTIMSLICYQMTEGSAMHLCEDWQEGNIARHLFKNAKLSSPSISRLFKKLGQDKLSQKFFKNYVTRFFPESHTVLIDSTALPSSVNADINAFGYGADGICQNVGCLMLVDQTSRLPIYFRAIPGDIADVSTLKVTVDEVTKLGLHTDTAILDAGYFSEKNIRFLKEKNVQFVTRMPRSRKIFKQLVMDSGPTECASQAVRYGERSVFIKTTQTACSEVPLYAHIILDPSKRAADIQYILSDALAEDHSQKQLDERMKYAGYFILISSYPIEPADILPTYYTRQSIEQIFGFAKSANNVLPLRVHSEDSIRGYLMLVFMTIVLYVIFRQKMEGKLTVRQALIRLRAHKAKEYEDEIVPMEINKRAREVYNSLEIIVPTKA